MAKSSKKSAAPPSEPSSEEDWKPMRLGDVGAKRVVTTGEDRTVRQVARLMNRHRIGSIVVTRKQRVVGIVTERDILAVVAKGKQPEDVKVRQVMSSPVVVGEEDNDMHDAVKLMVINNIKKLPIVRGNKLVGIVTLTDFARLEPLFHDMMGRALEESNHRVRQHFVKFLAAKNPPSGMYV